MSIFLISLGILLLYLGGEFLVRNSSSLARALGMSPLVIGLTVVAFGTSSPEMAASLVSAFKGAPEIAVGNVVGSNIANLGLILGLAALTFPLTIRAHFIKREMPIMISSGLLLLPLNWNGHISRVEGLGLLGLLGAYLFILLRGEERPSVQAEFKSEYGNHMLQLGWNLSGIAAGTVLLVVGADSLVEGAVSMAAWLGIPHKIIGLTVVAVGTSLPELASSLVAALRKEGDIIVGNLIGSNIFNVFCILGVTATAHPISLNSHIFWGDIGVMIGISVLLYLLLYTGLRLDRKEGLLLLLIYLVYVSFLYR